MVDNGTWVWFSSREEMEAHYRKNKFAVDYPDYPDPFAPGWYYVYTKGRYFLEGATDYYLCFVSAAIRIGQVKEHMVEVANELRSARSYAVATEGK